MAFQLSLFPGEKTFRQSWVLESVGVLAAADLIIQLIQEGVLPVLEFDIAKKRMGIAADQDVPPAWAHTFADLLDQIHDERYRIKARVEEISEYRLVIVDQEGRSTRNGGHPVSAGFALRNSNAGAEDDYRQIRMSIGSAVAAINRHKELTNGPEAVAALMQLLDPIQMQLRLKGESTGEEGAGVN